MTRSSGKDAAEAVAEHWLKQNGVGGPPVDVFKVAEMLDIHVSGKDAADTGVSGMLVRFGDQFAICYATHIKSLGFQRFSIAHEIGHYLLPGHAEELFSGGDGTHFSRAGFGTNDFRELEADSFASALLMPDLLFKAALRRSDEGLNGIIDLSGQFLTSLPATAVRYARKTSVPAAIIVSTDGRIDYAFLSDEMKEFPGIRWPGKGSGVPTSSLTAAFSSNRDKVSGAKQDADDLELDLWLGGRRGMAAKEEVIGLGAYGKVLTVLTTDFLAEEGDEETDLAESWTPRHHRR